MQERFNPQLKLASQERFAQFVTGLRAAGAGSASSSGSTTATLRSPGLKIAPINVEVSLTHVCQAKCDWCFYRGTHLKMTTDSYMPWQLVTELLEDMVELKVKAVTWTGGGEPTLHPQFRDVVEMVYDTGLKQGLFTNGLSLPKYRPELLEWIRVSNTDRDWNVTVLKELRKSAKVLGMALNYTGDDAKMRRAIEVAEETGVDYLQVRQALNLRGLVTELRPPEVNHPKVFITDYKFDNSANPHGYKECYGFNFCPFVWHDGTVTVCGYMKYLPDWPPDKSNPYVLGTLHRQRFLTIMANAPVSVPVCSSCQVCCKNHEANKLVNDAVRLKDVEFV